jgi:glycosyltransferase involved in cell wall biosynthesis
MVRRLADAAENPYNGPGPHMIAMGRLQHQKAYDVLLTAFTAVRKAIPGARLTILGEGPLEGQLKQQAAGLGVVDAVAFAGFQANPWPYVKHADLFVLASRYEGLPNSVLEALALGVSVVATDCPGGTREIQKSAGQIVLVPPESPDALAEAMIAALNSRQGRSSAAKESDESLRRFDIQTIVEEYSRLL